MNNAPAGKPSYFCIRNNGNMKKITALFTASLALFAAGCDKGESPLAPDTDATAGVSIPSDGSDENGNGIAGDGKTLIPFGTHGGSGVGSYKTMLQQYYPEAKYLESLGISGASVWDSGSKTRVQDWVKKLCLENKTE